MAENIGMLMLGAVILGGALYFTGALCQADIMNGALCPPGKGVWATGGGADHWTNRGAPGDSGRRRRGTISGYGDDEGYGSDYGFDAYAAHLSIA